MASACSAAEHSRTVREVRVSAENVMAQVAQTSQPALLPCPYPPERMTRPKATKKARA